VEWLLLEDGVSAQILKNLRGKDKETDIHRVCDLRLLLEIAHDRVLVNFKDTESPHRFGTGESSNLSVGSVCRSKRTDVNIRDTVTVGAEKRLITDVLSCFPYPATGWSVFSSVDNCHSPIKLIVRAMEASRPWISQPHREVQVIDQIVVEVLFDHFALVARENYELSVLVVSVKLHDVPENRFSSDVNHGLWAEFRFFTHSGSETACKDYNFHMVSLLSGDRI